MCMCGWVGCIREMEFAAINKSILFRFFVLAVLSHWLCSLYAFRLRFASSIMNNVRM